MSTFATTNRSNLRYALESQWASTPTSGVTREVRFTSHSMSTKKNTTKSNEIRDDRMVSDIIETEMMSDGGINFEMSAGSFDDMFQAFVLGTWTRPMTYDFWEGPIVSWIADNEIAVVGPTIVGYLTAGRRISTNGFVNPSNNNVWQIASTSYSGGQTVITVTDTTAVVEDGNISSIVQDANDVIVLKNTAIRAGTTSLATFDSNGGNAFASAISAGQLSVGQKIYVDGLGYGVGTATFTATAVAPSGVTVNDGENSYTFVAGTDFAVGASATNSATALAAAINNARVNGVGGGNGIAPIFLDVKATSLVGAVTITNLNATGGSLAKVSDGGGNITIVTFAGGDATQHGVYTLTAVTADVLYVTPAPTTDANAGSLPVTIRGSMLRNPSVSSSIVPQSFSIESFYVDVDYGFLQSGMMVNTFSLDVNSSAVMTGSFEFMGAVTTALSATQLGGGSYTPLATTETEVLSATTDVGAILQNGVPLSTAVKQIKIDGKAQLRNQMAVSSKFPVGIGTGRFELTGSATCYFENLTQFNHFLSHDTVSLAWDFQDARKCTYFWTVPALKFTADPINSKGIDQDVLEEITWDAFRDPISECMLQLDRFSPLVPFLG